MTLGAARAEIRHLEVRVDELEARSRRFLYWLLLAGSFGLVAIVVALLK